MAKKKFKKAIYLSGQRGKYSKVSKQIMKKLYDFTPNIEQYSIDEAFLDITGTEKLYKMSPVEIADKIRKTIYEEIGIPTSIGVSPTKTLSKIASEIAKNNTRFNLNSLYEGVFEINEKNLDEILSKTPIEEVWGVGKNLHKFFRKHNVSSALMYKNLDEGFIKRHLGKKGLELKEELKGISVLEVVDYYVPPKSISRTSSFKNFSDNREFILGELNNHLHEVCAKLREHGLLASTMHVMLRGKDFSTYYEKVTFKTPQSSEFEFYKTMHEVFETMYKKGVIYRSSGIILSKFIKKEDEQLGLFVDPKANVKKKLSEAWDKIEQKFGYGAINIGIKSEEIEKEHKEPNDPNDFARLKFQK